MEGGIERGVGGIERGGWGERGERGKEIEGERKGGRERVEANDVQVLDQNFGM